MKINKLFTAEMYELTNYTSQNETTNSAQWK